LSARSWESMRMIFLVVASMVAPKVLLSGRR
jgi:hypothetical protein